ncbi:hypothetical protein GCM10023319_63850 [Nocardia iowensis]
MSGFRFGLRTGSVNDRLAADEADRLCWRSGFVATGVRGPLLTRKLNLDLIAEHYDDLLRLAGSLKFGHATASLLVGKLSASTRQNALASALKEYGAMRARSTPAGI